MSQGPSSHERSGLGSKGHVDLLDTLLRQVTAFQGSAQSQAGERGIPLGPGSA